MSLREAALRRGASHGSEPRTPAPSRGARRALIGLAALLAVVLAPTAALAWIEVHVLGDDARVTVDRDGKAKVEHEITLKVGGGPLKMFEIRGVEPDATPIDDGYIVLERDARAGSLASAIPVRLEKVEPDAEVTAGAVPPLPTLRVGVDSREIVRGTYLLVVHYATDLAARGLVVQDGALTRIRWTGPVWDDGYESARTVFDLAAAPTEPRADETPDDVDDGAPLAPRTYLTTLKRSADRDVLELVRPYAPASEGVLWAIRADPRAVRPPAVVSPEAPAAQAEGARASQVGEPLRRALYLGGGAALFMLYAVLAGIKSRQVAFASREAGVEARPLVPLPGYARALLGGVALVIGAYLQIRLPSGTPGALLVGLAVALAVHRTPRWKRASSSLRGPGRWLSISEEDAFRRPPRPRHAWLDVSTRAGKGLLLASLAAIAGGVVLLHPISRHHAFLLALDAAVVLALFGTGRLRELPPDPMVGPARMLEAVARRVRKLAGRSSELRIVPRIRVPNGAHDADEMRLSIVPKSPLAGLFGIEVGIVYVRGAGGPLALPEVLLRVAKDSECEQAVRRMAGHGRSMRGRRPDERVLVFSPRLPTAHMTASIAAALALRATDRAREAAVVAAKPVDEPAAKRSSKRAA